MLAQLRRWWISITSVLGQCIVLSGVSGAGMESVTRITLLQSENTYNHPMLFQCRISVEDCGSTLTEHWVNVTCLRKVYSRPSDGLVLIQRRRRLTGIEPDYPTDTISTPPPPYPTFLTVIKKKKKFERSLPTLFWMVMFSDPPPKKKKNRRKQSPCLRSVILNRDICLAFWN